MVGMVGMMERMEGFFLTKMDGDGWNMMFQSRFLLCGLETGVLLVVGGVDVTECSSQFDAMNWSQNLVDRDEWE